MMIQSSSRLRVSMVDETSGLSILPKLVVDILSELVPVAAGEREYEGVILGNCR